MKRVMLLVVLTGCSSTPHQVKEVDTQLEAVQSLGSAQIGVNNKNQAVIQTETSASMELKLQQWKNNDLEQEIAYNRGQLTRCRTEKADPRLGGDGNVIGLPEDAPSGVNRKGEEFGMNQGSLKVVSKEFYVERLAAERAKETSLTQEASILRKSLDVCERELGYIRVKHGLPSKRIPGKGHFENGAYVHDRDPEGSLDDAFSAKASDS